MKLESKWVTEFKALSEAYQRGELSKSEYRERVRRASRNSRMDVELRENNQKQY